MRSRLFIPVLEPKPKNFAIVREMLTVKRLFKLHVVIHQGKNEFRLSKTLQARIHN